MSTILKALKKLEHDKQIEAVQSRVHDPLAPAIAPASAERGGPAIWLISAGVVVMFAIGVGFGVYTATTNDAPAGAEPLAVAAQPVAAQARAVPERPRFDRSAPVAGIEPVVRTSPQRAPSAQAPVRGGSRSIGRTSTTPPERVPPAPTPDATARGAASPGGPPAYDPWEADAPAVSAPESPPARDRSDQSSAAMAAAKGSPPVVAVPDAVSAGPPSDVGVGVPIDTLPVVDLPAEPVPAPAPSAPHTAAAPERRVGPESGAAPGSRVEPESSAEPMTDEAPARPKLADVVMSESGARIELKVLKTVWHPKPERRWAQLQVAGVDEAVEVRESEVFEGYVVEKITPSSVELSRGTVTVTHRVGR